MTSRLARVRKVVAYGVGVVAQGVALGLFHGNALAVAEGVVIVATGLGIYSARNAPPAAPGA